MFSAGSVSTNNASINRNACRFADLLIFCEMVCSCSLLHIYLPIMKKRSMSYTTLLRSCQPSVYQTKVEESRQVPFPTTHLNLPACSPHCPFNAECQAGKL